MSAGVLVLLVGAPGTGKSTLARQVSGILKADLVQTDKIRKLLFPEPRYTGGESAAVYGWCYNLISAGLKTGRRIVFDATNLEERGRRRLYDMIDAVEARLVIVWTSAPPAVVQERLLRRHTDREDGDLSDADWSIYLQLRRRADPVRRPHLVVNTTTELAPIVRRILSAAEDTEVSGARGPERLASQRQGHSSQAG